MSTIGRQLVSLAFALMKCLDQVRQFLLLSRIETQPCKVKATSVMMKLLKEKPKPLRIPSRLAGLANESFFISIQTNFYNDEFKIE